MMIDFNNTIREKDIEYLPIKKTSNLNDYQYLYLHMILENYNDFALKPDTKRLYYMLLDNIDSYLGLQCD